MKDCPIIFSAPMIHALCEDRKTQTRRVLKPQPPCDARYSGVHFASDEPDSWFFNSPHGSYKTRVKYEVGDRLWVRENFARTSVAPIVETIDAPWFVYPVCDNRTDYGGPWKPSIHMPRWASRLTLIVEAVKVERLQDISEEDAIAEGVYRSDPTEKDREWYRGYCEENGGDPNEPMEGVWMAPGARQGWGRTKAERDRDQWGPTAEFAYRCVWNSLHGPGAWDENPWVAAIKFRTIKSNIDQVGERG